MQAAERRKQQRTRLIAAAAVLAAIVGVVVLIQLTRDRVDTGAAVPAGVTEASGGIVTGAPIGSGKPVIEIYEDFQCPHCKDLEAVIAPTLRELADTGAATVVYRPISILGVASERAAAASGCAQDGGRFGEFHDVLFANQAAAAQAGGFSTALLADYGEQAGLTGSAFTQCVDAGRYDAWAENSTTAAAQRGVHGTPTVYVDGEQLELVPGDPNAAQQLRDAVGGSAG